MPSQAPRLRAAVILAAGQGTRMRSPTPKVLHKVAGRAMLDHVIAACRGAGCERIVVVVGAQGEAVLQHVTRTLGADAAVIQDPPLGTAHAVLAAKAALADFDGEVLVTNADAPLLQAETLSRLFEGHEGRLAMLGFQPADPGPYGRLVVRGGGLAAIVEAKDATPKELAIGDCYAGMLTAPRKLLFDLLAQVGCDNAKQEYYLTDVARLAAATGEPGAVVLAPETEVAGVNSQAELAGAEALYQDRLRSRVLEEGVTMLSPATVHLSWDTEIAPGVVVDPNVIFAPGVRVESGAVIRAFSHLEGCVVRAAAIIGPYARLRPGADIGEEARIGNFVEVKAATVGRGAKANHLSYLGDGVVGARANIGAGAIFCNYDGFTKAKTVVGEGAFIGSDSALIAPVTVGAGAYVGAGSVITEDVAPDALAVSRGRQVEKPGWAAAFRERKRKAKGG